MLPPIIKEFTSTGVDLGKEIEILETMVYFMQTDHSYDSVNFDDPISTASYFTKLCMASDIHEEEPVFQRREEILNQTFQNLMKRNITTKDGSTQPAAVQVHHIMRSAAEKIHLILIAHSQFSDPISVVKGCERFLSITVLEALASIKDVMGYGEDWEMLSG